MSNRLPCDTRKLDQCVWRTEMCWIWNRNIPERSRKLGWPSARKSITWHLDNLATSLCADMPRSDAAKGHITFFDHVRTNRDYDLRCGRSYFGRFGGCRSARSIPITFDNDTWRAFTLSKVVTRRRLNSYARVDTSTQNSYAHSEISKTRACTTWAIARSEAQVNEEKHVSLNPSNCTIRYPRYRILRRA